MNRMYGEEMVRKTLDGNKRQYAALLVSEGSSDGEICRQLDIEPHLLRAAKVNPNFPKQADETREFMKMVRAGREARSRLEG
jgi:hypothetical protein